MTLAPPQQEIEPTWSPRLEEYGRSEVGPILSWPGSFCFLPLETPTLEMIPPRTSPPCCETSKAHGETRYRTASPDHQPCEESSWFSSPLKPSDAYSPSHHLTTTIGAAPCKKDPVEPLQQKHERGSVSVLSHWTLGRIFYAAIDNQIPSCRIHPMYKPRQGLANWVSDYVPMKEQLEVCFCSLGIWFPINEKETQR